MKFRRYGCFEDVQLIKLIKHQNFSNSNGYIWEFCINDRKDIYSIARIVESIFDLSNCTILLVFIKQWILKNLKIISIFMRNRDLETNWVNDGIILHIDYIIIYNIEYLDIIKWFFLKQKILK